MGRTQTFDSGEPALLKICTNKLNQPFSGDAVADQERHSAYLRRREQKEVLERARNGQWLLQVIVSNDNTCGIVALGKYHAGRPYGEWRWIFGLFESGLFRAKYTVATCMFRRGQPDGEMKLYHKPVDEPIHFENHGAIAMRGAFHYGEERTHTWSAFNPEGKKVWGGSADDASAPRHTLLPSVHTDADADMSSLLAVGMISWTTLIDFQPSRRGALLKLCAELVEPIVVPEDQLGTPLPIKRPGGSGAKGTRML